MERTFHFENWKNERNNGRDRQSKSGQWLCRKFVGKVKEELIRISLSSTVDPKKGRVVMGQDLL
jgi:hypothetical protein